jgi:tripartite-type tricarboxylate transporter receptor subunit TctC
MKRMLWRSAWSLVAATGAAGVAAQQYPSKPVRVVVPHAAGGGSDTVARLIGAEITKAWGQQVIVENRVGAGGIIGSEYVARAAPDGYTLLVNEVGGMVIRLNIHPKAPFDPGRDFVAVAMGAYGANVLVCHPSLPVRSTAQLIALAKARPGELNFTVPGIGSVAHLAGVELEQLAGVKWAYIPYKGGGPAIQDLIGGQADFAVNGMLATYPHVRSGRLRAIAVASRGRHPAIPEVPTIAETVPGHESGSWQGILAPAGTPRDIVFKWSAEVARINATAAMKEKLAALGAIPEAMSPEQMQQFVGAEKVRWARVVQKAQIKLD